MEPQKNGNKDEAKMDHFFKLGRYSILVVLMIELMNLNQLGNLLYMMYSG